MMVFQCFGFNAQEIIITAWDIMSGKHMLLTAASTALYEVRWN